MSQRIKNSFDQHLRIIETVRSELSVRIDECVDMIVEVLARQGKILIMGNGGSAADAQHFAAEFVGRFLQERSALAAIALTTDTSILTAIGNDYGFASVFSRQVEALARAEDLVIGISTSGRSANIVKGLQSAKSVGCRTVGLLGGDGGAIGALVDLALIVSSVETPRVQEAHLLIIHILCDQVERRLFPAQSD